MKVSYQLIALVLSLCYLSLAMQPDSLLNKLMVVCNDNKMFGISYESIPSCFTHRATIPFSSKSLTEFFDYMHVLKKGISQPSIHCSKLLEYLSVALFFSNKRVSDLTCTLLSDAIYHAFDNSLCDQVLLSNQHSCLISKKVFAYFNDYLLNKQPHITLNKQSSSALGFTLLRSLGANKHLLAANKHYYVIGQQAADNNYKRIIIYSYEDKLPIFMVSENLLAKKVITSCYNSQIMIMGTNDHLLFDGHTAQRFCSSSDHIVAMTYNPYCDQPGWIFVDKQANIGLVYKDTSQRWWIAPKIIHEAQTIVELIDSQITISTDGNHTAVLNLYTDAFTLKTSCSHTYHKN